LPWPVRALRALDLPALERPAKATSRPSSAGSWRNWCTEVRYVARARGLDMGGMGRNGSGKAAKRRPAWPLAARLTSPAGAPARLTRPVPAAEGIIRALHAHGALPHFPLDLRAFRSSP